MSLNTKGSNTRASVTRAVANGEATKGNDRFSRFNVSGKHPDFDYSFQLRSSVEEGGGVTEEGFRPVDESNYAGEEVAGPISWGTNKDASKQIRVGDVILCKRPKSVTAIIRRNEVTKYNSQISLIKQAAPNIANKLRAREAAAGLDPVASARLERSEGIEYSQAAGPTEG